MFNKNPCIFVLLTSLFTQISLAAPQLKMVIFDENHKQTVADTDETGLTLHVFDHSRDLQNNAVPLKQYIHPRSEPASPYSLLSYSYADVYFSTGYRRDDLDWSIAAINGQPNILSELKWRDIEIATLNAGATLYSQSDWLVNLDITFGHIFDGNNQDSDYLGNNRTLEFSCSDNNANKGNILDISGHIGRKFRYYFNEQAKNQYLDIIPKFGFSYYSQNLRMTDGFQTIPATGAFAGLNSSYETTWWGPWLGVESTFYTHPDFSFGFNLEYHYAYYDATANWNLRPDFAHPKSFTHEADGYGLIGDIVGSWAINHRLSLDLAIKYQNWQADHHGVDTTFFSNGSVLKTPFNGVNWRSLGTTLGINYIY